MATAQDIVDAITALTTSTEELRKSQEEAVRASERARQAAAESARVSSPVNKLLGAYGSSGMAGRGMASGVMSGNLSGALQNLLQTADQVGAASYAVSKSLGGGGVGAVAGGAVGAASAITGVASAAIEFKRAMDESTRATIANYRELGKFSGAMASVLAQRDVREMVRDVEKGNRLADVAGALTQAEQDRQDQGKELEIAWEELKGGFLYEYQRLLGGLLEIGSDLAVSLKEYFGGMEDVKGVETFGSILDKAADKAERDLGRFRRGAPRFGDGGDF